MKQIDTPIGSTVFKKRDKSKSIRIIHSSHYEQRKIWGDSLMLLIFLMSEWASFPSSDISSSRYEVIRHLGEGTFGKVAEVVDHYGVNGSQGPKIAVKIIKSVDKYREAAKLEINVLEKLNSKDPKGKGFEDVM